MKIQSINFKSTSGSFGKTRVLPTYIIEEFKNSNNETRFAVYDEQNLSLGKVGVFSSVENAVKIFQYHSKARTTLV